MVLTYLLLSGQVGSAIVRATMGMLKGRVYRFQKMESVDATPMIYYDLTLK